MSRSTSLIASRVCSSRSSIVTDSRAGRLLKQSRSGATSTPLSRIFWTAVLCLEISRAMLAAFLARVDLKPDHIEIKMRRQTLIELLHAQSTEPITQMGKSDKTSQDILMLKVKARLQRVGREMRMLVENAHDQTLADPGLLRIIARAHDIQARLMQSADVPLHAIARSALLLVTSPGSCVFPCWRPTLSPVLSTARTPPHLTAKKLMRLALQIPIDWTEQRKLLGFHHR
jgi:site-specific DNA recombinase